MASKSATLTPSVSSVPETSKIIFARETWAQLERDGQELFRLNFRDLGLNQDKVQLALNSSIFAEVEGKGVLHIITARANGKLVGYHVSALLPHMHYKDAGLMVYTDAYYLHSDYRAGGTGAKMLMEVERTLRERGATKFYISTKVHSDNGPLLEAMGYSFTDKIFTKLL